MKQNCRNSKRSKKKRHIEATRVGYHGFIASLYEAELQEQQKIKEEKTH